MYAIAHVRGGGDLGAYWHADGMLMNKRNTFTDFITCAEHLIQARTILHRSMNLCHVPPSLQASHQAAAFIDARHHPCVLLDRVKDGGLQWRSGLRSSGSVMKLCGTQHESFALQPAGSSMLED